MHLRFFPDSSADNFLLLTATPHHGDDDRFSHFIRLLDPDIFPEPHRVGEKAAEIRRNILSLGPYCPWALRRLKEDLRDLDGRRLFPDRHAHTVTFRLTRDEYDLYKAVTAYINEFLPQASGRRQASVALARTVLQRRLASSTMAIYESIRRRLERQQELLSELDGLSPAQRARRLAQLQGRLSDVEQDEDDLDDADRDQLADSFTAAIELDQLRAEIAALQDLLAHARRVRDNAADSKLTSLRDCLRQAEFKELSDGRGKLLIFTEHRDTLKYLSEHLEKWGYTICQIHGSMNPHERKRAQELFRVERQVCVATEAAGEGINLQFCRLMINYDLPWNPTRLEQRLGRIHRIGQERDVHAFNFVATDSEEGQPIVEGAILQRLLQKLDQMRAVLDDRVFDVIGEVLSLNNVNLPEMLREAAFDPRRLDDYLDQIERIDPKKLQQYEQATGIALARANVDFSGFQQANAEAEERRHFVEVSRNYLDQSFKTRLRSAQDRVMALRARESSSPEVALARQRAENDLADLERTHRERLAGLDRLTVVRHGPVRYLGTALVFPKGAEAISPAMAPEDIDPLLRQRSEKAAEDLVVAYETARGWECERVGHLKIGFDVRSPGPADSQTGYRDPVAGIRRIEVKGRTRGHSIRLTTNEWYKAAQLGDSYWLYVIWDPLANPDSEPLKICNPVKHLDHAKREVVRYFDIPADAILDAARAHGGSP